jgi:hypothetical protein
MHIDEALSYNDTSSQNMIASSELNQELQMIEEAANADKSSSGAGSGKTA